MYTHFLFKIKKAYNKTTYFLSPPFYTTVMLWRNSCKHLRNTKWGLEMCKQMLKNVWFFAGFFLLLLFIRCFCVCIKHSLSSFLNRLNTTCKRNSFLLIEVNYLFVLSVVQVQLYFKSYTNRVSWKLCVSNTKPCVTLLLFSASV